MVRDTDMHTGTHTHMGEAKISCDILWDGPYVYGPAHTRVGSPYVYGLLVCVCLLCVGIKE